MANSDVSITITIDGQTHSLRTARGDVNELGRSITGANSAANTLRDSLGKMVLAVGGVAALTAAFKSFAASGIEANRSFENLKIQLTGLIAANSSNVSMMGKTLDAHTKWNMSMKESEGILKKLNETNAKTKFTLEEITGAFNMFYATSAGQGSRNKAVQAMDSIALAAQAVGKNLGDLTPMMDSLATGTVIAASEMGSFMKIVGLTNEELKKASSEGKVYDHIIEKLAKYKELSGEAAKGYEVALGSLKNELTELSRELTKPMFDMLTTGIATFSNFLKENKATIVEWAGYIVTAGKHLGLLAGAFVAAKIGTAAFNAVLGISRAAMAIFSSSLTATITLTSALGTGITALKAAFKGFLPTAIIFGAAEAFMALKDGMDGARASGEKLNQILNTTSEELSKLTKNQLEFRLVEIRRELDATKKEAGKLQDKIANGFIFMSKDALVENRAKLDELQNNILDLGAAYGEVQDVLNGKGASTGPGGAKTDSLLQNQIDAVSAALDKAGEKAKNVTTLGRLKTELAEIDGLIKNLQDPATDPEKEKKRLDTLEALQVMREKTAKQIAEFNKQDIKNLGDVNSAYREIARIGMSEYEKKLDDISQKERDWIKNGVSRQDAAAAKQKLFDILQTEEANKAVKEHKDFLNEKEAAQKEYYEAIGEYEKAWSIESAKTKEKIKKLELNEEDAKKYLEIQKKKYLEPYVKNSKAAFKDIKNSWADTVSSMQKTVDDGFFNFFIGKTKSLKTALKDIGTNLMRDLISPYARTLSQGISGGFGALLGGGSNLASIASNLGLAKNDSGGWSGLVGGTTVELSSTGEILRGASALDKSTTSLLSSVSNLQSAYSLLTSGYTGFISSFTSTPALNAASWLSMHGYAGLGQGVYGFGTGVKGALTATQFSSAGTAPYMAGSAFGGAALGYGIGYLGDKLFKANTYASTGGALGGAAGGLVAGMKAGSSMGPWGAVIGAVAGALIGGAFGKKKATGSGISVLQDITAGDALSNQNIRSYVDMQKKGWFSKKSWTEMSDLDDASMREIGAQLRSMDRMASRAGALASLTLKSGKYSGESLANEGFAKAVLRSMTGQAEQMWAEVTESGGKKRKGLLGKVSGVFEKAMKFSPSSIINRITKPLDDAVSKAMSKAGLGAIDNMARGMRDEFGKASDGNIFGLKSSRKIDDLLNLSRDESNKNQRLVDNPEFARMWKDWEEQAKKANKKVIELMSESLGAIADSYKSLELLTVRNPIKQVEISMRQAFESFTDAAEALKLEIPKELGSIADLSVEQMAQAYRKAVAGDFTKGNIESLNSLVKAYEAARKAQDDYTKAVLSFAEQVASTQAGFYQAHGIDGSFMSYQNIYTKFRTLIGALDKDIDENDKQGVLKSGPSGDINSWAKYFLSMSASAMGEFLSNGNVELRKTLIDTLTGYQNLITANGGHEYWLKSMSDLEGINKQIEALKILRKEEQKQKEAQALLDMQKEQAQKQLDALKEQLSILNLQKGAVEKIGSIAKSIRDSVIDRTTSTINYRSALEQARKAYASGDYGSKAFSDLSDAVSHQKEFYEDTAATYEDYKLAMLKMAGEIDAITNHVTLDTLDQSIKEVEDRIKKAQKELSEKSDALNKTGQDQLEMLEQQRQALIENSQKQLDHMTNLLGAGSPMVRYLKDVLERLIKPEIGEDGKPKTPSIPNYTTPGNINTGVNTANGAVVKSELDKFINQAYLSVLGRSVEQSGLDYWRDQIEKGRTSKQDLANALRSSARAITGSDNRADWIEWAKSKGYKPFADGGIVTRPTRALIGEAGYGEAVIPLDGRKLKIDAGDDFRVLSKKTERLETVMNEVSSGVKELVRYVRGIITEDGQGIYAKAKA